MDYIAVYLLWNYVTDWQIDILLINLSAISILLPIILKEI